ncbi:hypothetical protein ACJMK2_007299 [Sinanodonta woodiana]|uniref:C-type lectin domain-containing protein n=1 Tax=Sinanodonta woodiana TaxID=1069815 RepID=A0ABD3VJE2_SINWO
MLYMRPTSSEEIICFFSTKSQCKQGWIQHDESCYHMSHDLEQWADAHYLCHLLGGYLAEVNTAEEGAFLDNQVKLFHFGEVWVGATDLVFEGEWVWSESQSKLSEQHYTNWSPGEPNNAQSNENCMAITNTGYWNDAPCSVLLHYLCEMPSG